VWNRAENDHRNTAWRTCHASFLMHS
jgi:hypothetical protein